MDIRIIDTVLLVICFIVIIKQFIDIKAFKWVVDLADKLDASPTETVKMLDEGYTPEELIEIKKQMDEDRNQPSNKLDRIGF